MGIITTSGLILNITEIQAKTQTQTPVQSGQTELIANGKINGVFDNNFKPNQKASNNNIIAIDNNKEAEKYLTMGTKYYKSKEYQKAIESCTKAIELKPDYHEAYFVRGFIYYLELKEYKKALADFSKVIELKPNLAQPYFSRGGIYVQLKEYKKALADFSKVIELNSNDHASYFIRGNIYLELKEYQKAIADFNKVIELKPDSAEAYLFRGGLYALLKDYQKGAADAQKASQLFEQQKNPVGYQKAQQLLKLIAKFQKTN